MYTARLKKLWLTMPAPAGGPAYHPFLLLREKASLLRMVGEWSTAEGLFRRNMEKALLDGGRETIARAQSDLSAMLNIMGSNDEAYGLATAAYALWAGLGDEQGMANAASTIGSVHYYRSELALAMERYRERLAIAERAGDDQGSCQALSRIGLLHYDMGDCDRALEVLDQALLLAERLGSHQLIASTSGNMGNVHLERGRLDQALACYQRSYRESLLIGEKQSIAFGEGNIALVHQKQGHFAEAVDWTMRQYRAFAEMGDRVNLAVSLVNLGSIHLDLGEHEPALRRYAEVIALARENKDKPILSYALYLTGNALLDLGQPGEGERSLLESVAVAGEIGFNHYLCGYLARLARLYLQTGRADQAAEPISRARDMAQAAKRTDVLFDLDVTEALIQAGEDTAKAAEQLAALLDQTAEADQKADLLVKLFKLTGDPSRRQAAIEAYRALYRELPKYAFKQALKELGSEIP